MEMVQTCPQQPSPGAISSTPLCRTSTWLSLIRTGKCADETVSEDAFCLCRVLSDQELEHSVAGFANHGAATFSKGKSTSRYTFIPKSESPGPIYDIRAVSGIPQDQTCALLRLMRTEVPHGSGY